MVILTNLNLKNKIEESIQTLEDCKNSSILLNELKLIISECIKTINAGSKLLFMGNGGSAAEAQHMAAEYVGRFNFDRPPMAAVALTTDTSIISGVGNDYGYEEVFSRQVKAIGRENDLLFGYTTSGKSRNIIKAFEEAKTLGIKTVAFTGENSGKIVNLVDHLISVPASKTSVIQECHTVFGHLICESVENTKFSRIRQL